MTNVRLYGLHDPGGEVLLKQGDWLLISEEIGVGGGNYSMYAERGINVIVRLNNGYGATGTIPEPSGYREFTDRFVNFVRNSRGCKHWIVGNEPNHSQERPNGKLITASDYAACFRLVSDRFYYYFSDFNLITAAIAPWNIESGDWLAYYRDVLIRLQDVRKSGIGLHAYTHGSDPALITSEIKMSAPYSDRFFHFRAYRDFIANTPANSLHLPYYITEANQGDEWRDNNNGWIEKAYQEIDTWNKEHPQKIYCLILYRWQDYDRWGIKDKQDVQDDLFDAMQHNYTVDISNVQHTFLPNVSVPTPVNPPISPVLKPEWDPRLTQRFASCTRYKPTVGETYWQLTKARWLDADQSGGRHHVFIEVLDEQGKRVIGQDVTFSWSGGSVTRLTDKPGSEDYAIDFSMYNLAPIYNVAVAGASDAVLGMGLGSIEAPNNVIHTSYHLTFQRVTVKITSVITVPPAPPIVVPTPPVPILPIARPEYTSWAITAFSRMAKIEERFVRAVLQVEAGGRSFNPNGTIPIRFENHIFMPRVLRDVRGFFTFDDNNRTQGHLWRAAPESDWKQVHGGGQDSEYAAFSFARLLDEQAAFESISMGAGQVMGFNYELLGYPSSQIMYQSFSDREFGALNQIVGMFSYILNKPSALVSARTRDFDEFALAYNGAISYSALLKGAYDKL